MADLDPNALNRALVIYEKSFPDAANITYDGVIAAIRVYLAALPRASGAPEAEASRIELDIHDAIDLYGFARIDVDRGRTPDNLENLRRTRKTLDDLISTCRASGTPEAEAVAWRYLWKNDGPTARWRYVDADQRATFLHNLEEQPLYAAPMPVTAPPVELNEAEQRGVLYNAARYSEDGNKFYPGATTKAMHAMGYKIVPVAAPPMESQEMTREEQADALHGPLWRTAPDNRTAYEIVDCLRRDGFRIVRGAPKSGGKS
jgi:hypothetical protein